ncbi:MAG: hypothetical protein GDA45_04165 [Chromatiales bacterium]|nr:hypothetical protein [Chromatiales bacterium]
MKYSTAIISLFAMLVLSGCYASKSTSLLEDSAVSVGPQSSSQLTATPQQTRTTQRTIQKEIEVIIPVFDPNIPEDPKTREKKGIWPELRRVEAVNFALHMKKALEDTEQLGAVRVTPDQKVTGDLYVIGKIIESTGEDVSINIKAIGIDGKSWLNKNYQHRVDEYTFTSVRNKDKSPYDPVFEQAADDIAAQLRNKDQAYLSELNQLTEIRFGYSMSDESFRQFLKFRGDRVELVQAPADSDPMLQRIHQYRVEDQLFTDKMQQYYYDFDQKIDASYKTWQEAAFNASKAQREAKSKATWQALAGILAIGLGAVAASNSNSNFSTGASIGAVATGAVLLSNSAQNFKESKFHQETLMELGASIDVQVAPQVIEFEEQTVELTGDAATQFNQWRAALKKIYAEEQTPAVQL